MLLIREGPKMAAHDILWEGLIVLIMLIRFRECATGPIAGVVIHKLE